MSPMSESSRDRLKTLFEAAIAMPASERAAWLADACGGDAELRHELDTLLAAHDRPHRVFDTSAAPAAILAGRDALPAGYRIGTYEIVRHVGDGGMGSVYEATRSDGAFVKSVAIKVVHPGLHSAEMLRRFHSERQVLATLTHANIATLLDAGTTDGGRPYFVMEYVDGSPIDAYCDARELGLDDRLRLFLNVCAAVEHAHEHLVIHRDLKPDNVLVRHDGVVKLLDFGIAKVLHPETEGTDAGTTALFRPMTLRYASPEQVRGDAVTTSTDIYSLGVLLYQLLTRTSPYPLQAVSGPGMERAICDAIPVAPSVAAGSDSATPWQHRLRGDLDAIVLMALRKEPERRYRTVEQFGEDIRRYRSGLPIVARPDTARYRIGKFVRRNRLATVSAVFAVLALLGGVATTTWSARVARREAAAAIVERENARLEAVRVQRLNEFLTNVLALPDSNWYASGAGSRYDMTVADLLKQAGQRIDVELKDYPDLAADLHHTLGNTYRSRGMKPEAWHHFSSALALRQKILDARHPKVAESLFFLGAAEYWLGRRDRALSLYRQALAIERALPFEQARNLPYLLSDMGGVLRQVGDEPGARQALHEAVEVLERRYGPGDMRVAFPLTALGHLELERGDTAASRRLAERALELLRRAGVSAEMWAAVNDLADVELAEGQLAKAEALARQAIDGLVALKGNDPVLAQWRAKLSSVVRQQGRPREAIEIARAGVGDPTNDLRALALAEIGLSFEALGDMPSADRYLREAVAAVDAREGLGPCFAGQVRLTRAKWLRRRGRLEEAEPLIRHSMKEIESGCGLGSPTFRNVAASLHAPEP
jgi:serine/threonine-protein kinase